MASRERGGQDVYNNRYEHGYMSEWPEAKKCRVAQLVGHLLLPAKGSALDFGCGVGVFSAVLRDTLSEWDIWGSEISDVALERARERVASVRFLSSGELVATGRLLVFPSRP